MNSPFANFCEQCRYFNPGESLSGSCHRFPPVFAGESSPRETHHWRFPAVGNHGWCGEFRLRADAQAAADVTSN